MKLQKLLKISISIICSHIYSSQRLRRQSTNWSWPSGGKVLTVILEHRSFRIICLATFLYLLINQVIMMVGLGLSRLSSSCNVTFGGHPDSEMVTQQATGYSYEAILGILRCHFKMVTSLQKHLVTMVTGTCGRGTPYVISVRMELFFFQYCFDFFFAITFKWALFMMNT